MVDATSRVMPGVTLVLVDNQSQAKYEIKSDEAGRFTFVGLPRGQYHGALRRSDSLPREGTLR